MNRMNRILKMFEIQFKIKSLFSLVKSVILTLYLCAIIRFSFGVKISKTLIDVFEIKLNLLIYRDAHSI